MQQNNYWLIKSLKGNCVHIPFKSNFHTTDRPKLGHQVKAFARFLFSWHGEYCGICAFFTPEELVSAWSKQQEHSPSMKSETTTAI